MEILQGKSVFADICIGRLSYYRRTQTKVQRLQAKDWELEFLRFEQARLEAVGQLKALRQEAAGNVSEKELNILKAHEVLLYDAEYTKLVQDYLKEEGVNLEYAVSEAGRRLCHMLSQLPDEYLRERAEDMADVTRRILTTLSGERQGIAVTQPSIIAAQDLTPSETIALPGRLVLGFVTNQGNVYSHTAILAKSLGVPAVVGIGECRLSDYDGQLAAIDGYSGLVYLAPDEETLRLLTRKKERARQQREELKALIGKENITKSGRRIRVCANVGSLADVEKARKNDAGGIGLFRSELLYLDGDKAPDEETQFALYAEVIRQMEDKEVVIRTLDIGADKQVPYLALEDEENPALGLRAIRLGLSRPELLLTQLKALYRAGVYGELSVLYPMIISLEEIHRLKALEQRARQELLAEGKTFCDSVRRGIMIETPAAALISDVLAQEVDFFSVGTNDLTQYTLAVDRQAAGLDVFYDPHHEAVLRLIEMTAENGHRAGIPVGVCGELASDLTLTERFLEMGIDELSVAPVMILPLRKKIRESSF